MSQKRAPLTPVLDDQAHSRRRLEELEPELAAQGNKPSQTSYSHPAAQPFFLFILNHSGIFLHAYEDGLYCVCNEPVRSRMILSAQLNQQSNRLKEFVDQLVEYWNDEQKLSSCLNPLETDHTRTNSQGNTSTRFTTMGFESLVKMLLRISCVQDLLIEALIEKMTTLAHTHTNTHGTLDASSPAVQILHHLRYLEVICDPSALTFRLLQALEVCPVSLQIEIITSIPEVVIPNDYGAVLEKFQELLTDPGLVRCVLDSLANLCLPTTMMDTAADMVMSMLESTEPSLVPCLVRFLLDICNQHNAANILAQVRARLVSMAGILPEDDDTTSVSVLIEVLRNCIQFRDVVTKAYVKLLDSHTDPLLCTDLWLLFCLADSARHRSKAVSILSRRCIGTEAHTSLPVTLHQTLLESLQPGSHALKSLFTGMLVTAQGLLSQRGGFGQTGMTPAHRFGMKIYTCLYDVFQEGFHRQEVIVSLVSHASSGMSLEVDMSLEILKALGSPQSHTRGGSAFSAFMPFIKSLLEHLDRLSHEQLRVVFDVVFRAKDAYGGSDDVMILIRKLLGSLRLEYRKIGALGSVAYLASATDNEEIQVSLSQRAKEMFQFNSTGCDSPNMYVQFAEEVFAVLNGCAETFIFMLEELSSAAEKGQICLQILQWLFQKFSTEFSSTFVVSSSSSSCSSASADVIQPASATAPKLLFFGGNIKGAATLGLDGGGKDCIGILSSLATHTLSHAHGESEGGQVTAYLAPVFRLISTCAKAMEITGISNDSTIYVLAASSILTVCNSSLCELDALPETYRTYVCMCVKYTADFIRECVNACTLMPQDSEDKTSVSSYRMVSLRRLMSLVEVETSLLDTIMRHTRFLSRIIPPYDAANFKPIKKSGGSKKEKESASSVFEDAMDRQTAQTILESILRPLNPRVCFVLGWGDVIVKHKDEYGLTQSAERVNINLAVTSMLLNHMETSLASMNGHDGRRFCVQALGNGVFSKMGLFLQRAVEVLTHDTNESELYIDMEDSKDMWPPFRCCLRILQRVFKMSYESDEEEDLVGPNTNADLNPYPDANPYTSLPMQIVRALVVGESPDNGIEDSGFEACVELFNAYFQLLKAVGARITDLPLAVELTQTLECTLRVFMRLFNDLGDMKPLTSALCDLCNGLLQRDWVDSSGKRKYGANDLRYLVNAHLLFTSNPMERTHTIATLILPELLDTPEQSGPVASYPTLTAASFVHYLTPLMQTLAEQWSELCSKARKPDAEREGVMEELASVVEVFVYLVNFSKGVASLEKKPVLLAVLREGRRFLEIFLKSQILQTLYKTNQEFALDMVTKLQGATRHMQHVCQYGKTRKEAALAKQAPAIRKVLERMICEMREIANEGGFFDALKLGNLKPKNIDGTAYESPEDCEEVEDDTGADTDD